MDTLRSNALQCIQCLYVATAFNIPDRNVTLRDQVNKTDTKDT